MESKKVNSQIDTHWESRTLCSDESCIGVVGPDRHCRECGKKFDGDLPNMTIQAEVSMPAAAPKTEHGIKETKKGPVKAVGQKTQLDNYWKNRTLCSDESCIGVIGPNRRCKECGKRFIKG